MFRQAFFLINIYLLSDIKMFGFAVEEHIKAALTGVFVTTCRNHKLFILQICPCFLKQNLMPPDEHPSSSMWSPPVLLYRNTPRREETLFSSVPVLQDGGTAEQMESLAGGEGASVVRRS